MATTQLDANQVIKRVYDPETESLKTTASAVFPGGQIEVDINAEEDSIAISDGTNTLVVNPDGSINVNIDSTPGTIVNEFNEVLSVPSGLNQLMVLKILVHLGEDQMVIQRIQPLIGSWF